MCRGIVGTVGTTVGRGVTRLTTIVRIIRGDITTLIGIVRIIRGIGAGVIRITIITIIITATTRSAMDRVMFT